jgi:predicted homoserine dehydrogenase-like protein
VIIVDRALEQRERDGNPIRVALVGAGFMARGIALQLMTAARGVELVAIANRHAERAREAWAVAGVDDAQPVAAAADVDRAAAAGARVYTDDPGVVCSAAGIDAVIEATGAVEFGATVALAAIENGKHFVSLSAELDGTIGPALKRRADTAGVVYTLADGDQPGVTMNLYRFVTGVGARPVLCGNIKGLHDPYRNPTTQEGFARRWGQNAQMVTSFADGSKISFEQAVVANATGMRVAKRGMHGPTVPPGTPVEEAARLFPLDELEQGPGIVDYVVGASPAPGVFVLAMHDHPLQRHYLELYKLGTGPLYCFYTPYHLCHFEVPTTVGRAALFGDAALAAERLFVEVVATAKVDLQPGDVVDGPGGYLTYGLAENADTTAAEGLLPMGLAEGCRMRRLVPKDQVLRLEDVELPAGRVADALRREQDAVLANAYA